MPGGETVGEHAHGGVELIAREIAVGIGATQDVVQRVFVPFLAGDFGHDLLREHVERLRRLDQRVEFAAAHAVEQGGAFHQVVARGGKQARLGRAVHRVAGAARALQEGGDGARRSKLANQIHVADIDAQFQRSGGDQYAQVAAFEALFCVESLLFCKTAVMCGDDFLAEAFGQMTSHTLGHATRVDEDERGAMRLHQLGEAVVDEFPAVVGHHRFERHRGDFDGEVAVAGVADVDDVDAIFFLLPCGEKVARRVG